MKNAIVNFNGGEFSPKIDARSDTEKYIGGCRQSDNMLPSMYGGSERRPGTEFISTNGAFNTMLDSIVSNDNIVMCLDNTAVVTSFDSLLSQITCWQNDVMCVDNEVVSDVNIPFLRRAICCDNDLVFYEGDVVYV